MSENFVDIVGYQLEKVHTGVIAWLLDTERSPLPTAEQTTLAGRLAPSSTQGAQPTSITAVQEYSFGRRLRIDLVLELHPATGPERYILIECKTDSDVSVAQLQESSKAFASRKPNVPFSVIVLALGAGQATLRHQLREIRNEGYQAVDLPHALEVFSNLSIAGKRHVYDEWVAALDAEHTRAAQIDEALARVDHPWDSRLLGAGYRTGFPVFYMFGSSGFLVGTYDILCSALWGTHPPDPLGFIALEARAAP